MRRFIRKIVLWLARLLGSEIRDVRTGKPLGRALLLPWRGRILVIGAECELWIPAPSPQKELVYWKQELGFTTREAEFPPRTEAAGQILKTSAFYNRSARVLLVSLDHRPATITERALRDRLGHGFPEEDILLVYGGKQRDFTAVQWAQKVFAADPRLRTTKHIRERQSYRGVFEEASRWMTGRAFTHVLFLESDHLLLQKDVPRCFLEEMQALDADVLGYEVRRMDGTIHPHWLGTVQETYPSWPAWSMLGAGHFWKREVWDAVAQDRRHAEWFLELDLPTTARELGFSLQNLRGQERFVVDLPENLKMSPAEAEKQGAWSVHPVK
jgi:hypothetical protein